MHPPVSIYVPAIMDIHMHSLICKWLPTDCLRHCRFEACELMNAVALFAAFHYLMGLGLLSYNLSQQGAVTASNAVSTSPSTPTTKRPWRAANPLSTNWQTNRPSISNPARPAYQSAAEDGLVCAQLPSGWFAIKEAQPGRPPQPLACKWATRQTR